MGFEKGYDTMVGERGEPFRWTEQRVAIARTVLKNHPILVFDDSLSAVDMETEYFDRDALNSEARVWTTFYLP